MGNILRVLGDETDSGLDGFLRSPPQYKKQALEAPVSHGLDPFCVNRRGYL